MESNGFDPAYAILQGHDLQNRQHPHEKPRELYAQLIDAVTNPGDVVVDPFFGSGGSLIEAYSRGRDFFGVELEEVWRRQAVEAVHKMAEKQFGVAR